MEKLLKESLADIYEEILEKSEEISGDIFDGISEGIADGIWKEFLEGMSIYQEYPGEMPEETPWEAFVGNSRKVW